MHWFARVVMAAGVVVVLGTGLPACGGDDDDSASKGTVSTISDKDARAAARAAGVDESCVQGVQAYTALAGAAGSAFSGTGGDIDKSIKAFQDYADKGPSAIRDDLHVVADAYEAYAKAVADSGWVPSSGKPPTQEQAAAISAGGEKISDAKVKTASDHISAYFDEHCKRK